MKSIIGNITLNLPSFKDLPVGTLVIISDEKTGPDSFARAIICDKSEKFGGFTEAIVINPHHNTYSNGNPWKAGEKLSSLNTSIIVIPITESHFGDLDKGTLFMHQGKLRKRTGMYWAASTTGKEGKSFEGPETVYAIDQKHTNTDKQSPRKERKEKPS